MTATTSKLGADMTDSQWILDVMGRYDFTMPQAAFDEIVRKLSARQPAAIEQKNAIDHPAALDEKALATAQEIALMWGRDRSQFVSRIQVAVRDAMDWVRAASTSANVRDERRRFSSADEFDKWAAASEERADQVERAAFVKLMGYDLPTVDGAAKDVWEGQRATWLEALEFAASTSANVAQGAEAVQFVFPPMPQAVVMHEKLGPLFDRLSMQFYADKCMCIAAPPAQAALTDDARDAARYRWMRRTFIADDESWPDDVSNATTGEELDAAVDAALTAAQPASGDSHV